MINQTKEPSGSLEQGPIMLWDDQECQATTERIAHFQAQVDHLLKVETNSVNRRDSAAGFQAEIDRMRSGVREDSAKRR